MQYKLQNTMQYKLQCTMQNELQYTMQYKLHALLSLFGLLPPAQCIPLPDATAAELCMHWANYVLLSDLLHLCLGTATCHHNTPSAS